MMKVPALLDKLEIFTEKGKISWSLFAACTKVRFEKMERGSLWPYTF